VIFQENASQQHVEQALKVLRFLSFWKGPESAKYIKEDKTIDLCSAISNSSVDKRWHAARLVMQIGFRDRERGVLMRPESAAICVDFLEHHLADESHSHHDSIADAFNALTLDYHDPVYDLKGNIARGICTALKDSSRSRLYRAALRFVYHIRHKIGDPENAQVFIDHGFSSALKATWVLVSRENNRDNIDVITPTKCLGLFRELSRSSIWHPYLLHDHWEIFRYATPADLLDWLGPLLKGDCARKTFSWKPFAEYIRIAWQTGLYNTDDPELVHSIINVVTLYGKPAARGLAKVVKNALRAIRTNQENAKFVDNVELAGLVILKQLVNFCKDTTTHAPSGWEGDVISKTEARKRKVIQRMWRRRRELRGSS
jgi:hypothetical protein